MPTERELPAEWPTLSLDRRVAWAAIALAFPIATHQLTSTSLGVRERDVVALIRPGGSATSFAQVNYSVFQPNPRRARRDRYRALAASLRRRMSEPSDYDARVGPVVAEEIARDRVRFGEWQGLRHAAELWAGARAAGQPTAGPDSLDADVILAAQALAVDGTIVTENARHLERYAPVTVWS